MPQKKLKKWLPKPEQILENKTIKLFAPQLADPRLWHFNRRCLTKAVYIGVLSSFFPLPGQSIIAIFACLYFKANIPMAIALTWITNPLTTIPIFYFAYIIGAKLLDMALIDFSTIGHMLADLSLWIFADGANPFVTYNSQFSLSAFLLGLCILALISSVVSGIAFRFFWRYKVVTGWKKRHGYRPPHLIKKYQKAKYYNK